MGVCIANRRVEVSRRKTNFGVPVLRFCRLSSSGFLTAPLVIGWESFPIPFKLSWVCVFVYVRKAVH